MCNVLAKDMFIPSLTLIFINVCPLSSNCEPNNELKRL